MFNALPSIFIPDTIVCAKHERANMQSILIMLPAKGRVSQQLQSG